MLQSPSLPGLRLPRLHLRHVPATVAFAAIIGVNLFAGMSLLGPDEAAVAKVAKDLPAAVRAEVPPPAAEPLQFKSVEPDDAVAINAAVPIATGPNPAAKAFSLAARAEADRARALDCLTAAVYYEAATEPTDGQRAVAQVVLNRVRHPAFPNSVCGVVYQGAERATGCQFTFTCDGSLRRLPMTSYWERARKVAQAALAGEVYKPVGYATHYHTNWVVPYWSSSLAKIGDVGTHIFYRWAGGWGRPPAFAQRYAGAEPVINLAALRARVPVTAADATDAAAAEKAKEAAEEAHSVDSFQRAVLRRYEPMPGSAIAQVLAEQASKTDPEDKDANSHRWAMTGDGLGTSGAPLGRPTQVAKAEPAKPLGAACASSVRKVGEAAPAGC